MGFDPSPPPRKGRQNTSREILAAVEFRMCVQKLNTHRTPEDCPDINMVWLRLVGSLKLYVSFAEYRLFFRALLQESPIILSILLTEATP